MKKQVYKESITVRKDLDFGLDSDDIPRYWVAGDPFVTRVLDAVQSTFPDGERYFIASVRAFKSQITNPDLLREVQDFMQQEGQHGMVHSRYNERLRRQGINIDAFTKRTKVICNRRLEKFSPEYNVAVTAALEHFTAMMADLFFAEKLVLEGADYRVRAMLAWHAIEEMEHKAVAFDVMQQVAGVKYSQRALAMTHIALLFSLYCFVAPWFMLRMDGFSRTERLKMYGKGTLWLFGPRRGIFTRLVPMLAAYYKPGFHPNKMKTVHNYSNWITAYGANGDPLQAAEAMYEAAA